MGGGRGPWLLQTPSGATRSGPGAAPREERPRGDSSVQGAARLPPAPGRNPGPTELHQLFPGTGNEAGRADVKIEAQPVRAGPRGSCTSSSSGLAPGTCSTGGHCWASFLCFPGTSWATSPGRPLVQAPRPLGQPCGGGYSRGGRPVRFLSPEPPPVGVAHKAPEGGESAVPTPLGMWHFSQRCPAHLPDRLTPLPPFPRQVKSKVWGGHESCSKDEHLLCPPHSPPPHSTRRQVGPLPPGSCAAAGRRSPRPAFHSATSLPGNLFPHRQGKVSSCLLKRMGRPRCISCRELGGHEAAGSRLLSEAAAEKHLTLPLGCPAFPSASVIFRPRSAEPAGGSGVMMTGCR